MMDSERQDILHVFVQETADQLEALDELLLELEAEPDSPSLQNQFMRVAHTLKGSAGVVGLASFAALAHAVEGIVQALRDQKLPASPEMFDKIAQAVDAYGRSLVDVTEGNQEPASVLQTRNDLNSWLSTRGAATEQEAVPDNTTDGLELGEYDWIRLKVLDERGKLAYRVEVTLGKRETDKEKMLIRLERVLLQIGVVVATAPAASDAAGLLKANRLLILVCTERSAVEVSKFIRAELSLDCRVRPFREAREPSSQESRQQLARAMTSERTVRMDMKVLDDLLTLVGELMISRDRFEQVATEIGAELGDPALAGETSDSAATLGHLAALLQDAIMRARMVPVARVFRAMKRELRRKARADAGHLPSTQFRGEDTELDKNLVDALTEPLSLFMASHLTAAVSEETADEALEVSAERRWNQILLTISSTLGPGDGATERLRVKVASVGGRLEARANPAGFATYTISLPLTLAIIRVMLVSVGGELYAIPVETLEETIRLRKDDVAWIQGSRVVDLRGGPLSLLHLGETFEVPNTDTDESGHLLVIGDDDSRIGVVVEELLGIREVVIKPLSARFSHVRTISGCAILDDERIALILSTETLADEALANAYQRGSAKHIQATPEGRQIA